MGLRNGILIRIRKKHIRIGNKFDCVEGVRNQDDSTMDLTELAVAMESLLFPDQ